MGWETSFKIGIIVTTSLPATVVALAAQAWPGIDWFKIGGPAAVIFAAAIQARFGRK